jgi:hypothetical protein
MRSTTELLASPKVSKVGFEPTTSPLKEDNPVQAARLKKAYTNREIKASVSARFITCSRARF